MKTLDEYQDLVNKLNPETKAHWVRICAKGRIISKCLAEIEEAGKTLANHAFTLEEEEALPLIEREARFFDSRANDLIAEMNEKLRELK